MFFKRLVDSKKDEVKIKIIPKSNEEFIVVKYGGIRFIDSYRFLSEGLDKLVWIIKIWMWMILLF